MGNSTQDLMQRFIDSYKNETVVWRRHIYLFQNNMRHLTKKNSRPIFKKAKGKPFLGKSKELKETEHFLAFNFAIETRFFNIGYPLIYPVHCIYHFHFGPEHSRSYKLCDLTNLFEIVSDALQASGIIKNDRQIYSVDGSRKIMSNKTYLDVSLLRDNSNGIFEP